MNTQNRKIKDLFTWKGLGLALPTIYIIVFFSYGVLNPERTFEGGIFHALPLKRNFLLPIVAIGETLLPIDFLVRYEYWLALTIGLLFYGGLGTILGRIIQSKKSVASKVFMWLAIFLVLFFLLFRFDQCTGNSFLLDFCFFD